MPNIPPRWKSVRTGDNRWFHSDDQHEINFNLNGSVTFAVMGEHVRMGYLTLTIDEQAWVAAHRDWLLTQPDAVVTP